MRSPTLPITEELRTLSKLVGQRGKLLVLTGAGCSTASGIPDYRGPDGRWKHSQPIRYQEFLASGPARQRYWARSMIGWVRVERALPNRAHRVLAAMEHAGIVHHLVTQNVDGLHQHAGHRRVVDLHGRLAWVVCLRCSRKLPRSKLQTVLETMNKGFRVGDSVIAPDGDAAVPEVVETSLKVPDCPKCGGILKPDVVFFGENVPRTRVAYVREKLRSAGMLLVVGSSLSVYSGFRFCQEATELGIPVAIVNRGQTRADGLAACKLEAEVGRTLVDVADILGIDVVEG